MSRESRIQTNFLDRQSKENAKRGTNRAIVSCILIVLVGGLAFGAFKGFEFFSNFGKYQFLRNVSIVLKSPRHVDGKATVEVAIANANAFDVTDPVFTYTVSDRGGQVLISGEKKIEATIPAADNRSFKDISLGAVNDVPARMHTDLKDVTVKTREGLPKRFASQFSQAIHTKNAANQLKQLHDLYKQVPDYAPLMVAIGMAYERGSQWQDALQFYQMAVEKNPDSANAHYHLGVSLVQAKKIEEARAELKKASELSPRDPAITTAIASLDAQLPAGQ